MIAHLSAQNHLSFKGVPIDGTLQQYTQQMQAKGFMFNGNEKGISMLSGDFAGYKNCTVYVSTLNDKDLVNTITVMFPSRENWATLFSDYSNLKEMLAEKYGEPKDVVEKFDSKYVDNDFDRIHALTMDRCKYTSVFSTKLGDIELSIQHEGSSNCFVMLKYYDKTNSDAVRTAAPDDL